MSDEQSQDVETLELDNDIETTEEEVAVDPTMTLSMHLHRETLMMQMHYLTIF